MMIREPTRGIDGHTGPGGSSRRVTATVWVGKPVEIVPVIGEESEDFTEDVTEDALDKAGGPVKGKYADLLPSSEEFIRDKRKEVELEDRPS